MIYELFIPTPNEIEDWEGKWLFSNNQARDGNIRYELVNNDRKTICKLIFLRGG